MMTSEVLAKFYKSFVGTRVGECNFPAAETADAGGVRLNEKKKIGDYTKSEKKHKPTRFVVCCCRRTKTIF